MLGKKFSLIVAVNALGYIDNGENGLPWDKHFQSDMERFKAVTMGNVVVMGRKTFDSIGRPLPGRINVVLTSNKSYVSDPDKQLYICHDIHQLNMTLAMFVDCKDVIVIGGGKVYNLFRPLYETIYITQVLKNNKVGTIKFNYPEAGNSGWAVAERKLISDELKFITLVNAQISQTPKFIF